MGDPELVQRFASGRVAQLATVRPNGAPHIVPVVFAVQGSTVYTAVDDKPKSTRRLQRLANVRHQPRCSLLVEHYEHDWSRLWWVRADGSATVVDEPPPEHPGLVALIDRYPQYRAHRPSGPLLVIEVDHWSSWSAS